MPRKTTSLVPASGISPSTIEARIHQIRGHRVMLDSDLADMYGVETRILNRAVARNASRFPVDFAFTLTSIEVESLRSQIGISNARGGRRYAPRVFTEQGVAMLSSVLRSRRAVEVNIAIMRAFVQLREMLTSHKDLARRIDELEQKYDGSFATVFDAIRELASPPASDEQRARIGFLTDPDASKRPLPPAGRSRARASRRPHGAK
jgi:ORF6N domain